MDATRLSDAVGGTALADAPPEPLHGVAGVLFDPPGVLYDGTVWRRWLLRLVTRMGISAPYNAFFEDWDNEYLDDVHVGRRTLKDALGEFLHAAGLARALADEVVAAAAAQRKQLEDEPRLLSGAAATLELLCRRGLALAISADTDLPSANLRCMVRKLGVAELFRAVVSSRDLYAVKPAAKCYLAAADALQLPPQSIAFVGFRSAHLAGAKAVGMPTVALGGPACEMADRHVPRIHCLAELFPAPAAVRRAG